MGLCCGDVSAATCFTCLTQAFLDLPNYCSYQKDASIYYDACILHYSDVHVLSSDDYGPQFDMSNIYNLGNVTSDPARYNRLLAALVNHTADYAAYNSTRRFATGEADFDLQPHKVYTVAQCTPDQTPAECRRCLARLIMTSLPAFFNHTGGRTLWFNCTYRFETSPFYNGPAMVRLASRSRGAPATAPAVQPTVGTPGVAGGGERKLSVPVVVPAILLPIISALNLVVCFCFWRRRRSAAQVKNPYPRYSTETEDIEMVDSILIDVSTLRAATDNFAESNKLGQGGFGTVYKGTLPNGDEIAVKRLSQGGEELKNELALVAKLKHKNLARLLGVCLEQQERLLVYEFVPNRSLDLILFDIEKREQLDWEQRYKIINGVARGLQYLHEDSQLKVVHRDLKASNILLDANMNPKISDFGLARIFGRDQTQAVTNRVVGT
ncbi:cysteine-rich receptor-like protein kinase 6 isoform X2 [Lolium perenne]